MTSEGQSALQEGRPDTCFFLAQNFVHMEKGRLSLRLRAAHPNKTRQCRFESCASRKAVFLRVAFVMDPLTSREVDRT